MPRTSFLPTSNPSTNSGRLSHHMVSLGLGSDVSNLSAQNTWKLPDISSLHNVFKTGTFQNRKLQTFISSEDNFLHATGPTQYSASARRRSFGASRRVGPKDRSPVSANIGGAERDRTADPLLAKQVLSQLSYSPIQLDHLSHKTRRGNNSHQPSVSTQIHHSQKQMVGPGRLELPTPRLSSVCSNQLSYGPIPVPVNAAFVFMKKEKRGRRDLPYQ
jgi:hypothetical protein